MLVPVITRPNSHGHESYFELWLSSFWILTNERYSPYFPLGCELVERMRNVPLNAAFD